MDARIEYIATLLEQVPDPEVPVLSVIDLGIIRHIAFFYNASGEEGIEICITPTYSGCPAMDTINMQVKLLLYEYGFTNVRLTRVLSPAWTTDWMSAAGKNKLMAYGIAAPVGSAAADNTLFAANPTVACPQCQSFNTSLISQFGSTACKALYRCNDCLEPFDYFKCH